MEIIINSPQNPIFFHIFNYPIRYYGIIMSLAIFCGIFLSEYLIKLKHSNKTLEIFQDSIPFSIIFSIIGARIFYVLGSFEYYFQNKKEIIMINHGGMSIFGGIIFGIFAILIYAKIKQVKFFKFADFYALVFPLCQAIGRFGNFFNQEAYGRPTDGVIKLFIDKAHRIEGFYNTDYYHPAFLYESILDLVIFAILLLIYKKSDKAKNGTIFASYLIFYGIIRLFIENIRIDSVLDINNFHIASIISVLAIICGVVLLFFINRHNFNH